MQFLRELLKKTRNVLRIKIALGNGTNKMWIPLRYLPELMLQILMFVMFLLAGGSPSFGLPRRFLHFAREELGGVFAEEEEDLDYAFAEVESG